MPEKSIREAIYSQNSRIGLLEEVFPALRFEPFRDFADVLGAFAGANEQRVGRLNHNKITDANRGKALVRGKVHKKHLPKGSVPNATAMDGNAPLS